MSCLHELSRTELLIGTSAIQLLRQKTVAVMGIGGVGSYAVEALARCGLGRLVLVDGDIISITNINRQIHATRRTIGLAKVEVMKDRVKEIDSSIEVDTKKCFVTSDNVPEFFAVPVDYVIEAMDTVSAKVAVAVYSTAQQIPVISCMGAGNKLDPTRFYVTDIYKTRICPLARVMRRELRKRGIASLKVVVSDEPPSRPSTKSLSKESETYVESNSDIDDWGTKRLPPGSISFVPPVAGFILAAEVVKDLLYGSKGAI